MYKSRPQPTRGVMHKSEGWQDDGAKIILTVLILANFFVWIKLMLCKATALQ